LLLVLPLFHQRGHQLVDHGPERQRLSEVVVPSGHWMQQEKPVEVNARLAEWPMVEVAGSTP
jgi:pimeloyl-ACP methyl ester carboxylesterase